MNETLPNPRWQERVASVAPETVESKAEEFFAKGGFHCAESMLLAFSEALGVPVDLRYVRGFGGGLGQSRCLCGAVNGASVFLGLVLAEERGGHQARGGGRDAGNHSEVDRAIQKLEALFKERYRANCCRWLTRKIEWGTPSHLEHCVSLTGETAKMLLQVLQEEMKADRAPTAQSVPQGP
ncbi:C-GCAxxG-C-C family protein [Verrucomicrobium sp. 3C]|uniref:C-GCAxxG-C-C family protein n=1 Tax=Verrucomicrobium sp. 3C TaxID=1134055 RepID=UPI00037187CD|nr:C-GCAxxG-C-C family protein [Verrucomicrobium sp. 3C]